MVQEKALLVIPALRVTQALRVIPALQALQDRQTQHRLAKQSAWAMALKALVMGSLGLMRQAQGARQLLVQP